MTQSFIEKLNQNEEVLEAMMAMPESANERLPSMRRKELFSFLWEEADMDRVEVMNLVNQRELEFVREYGDLGVPEWMLRCEAQDVLLEMMHERFEEEGLL